jgi:predicted nucleic acid-binding protein
VLEAAAEAGADVIVSGDRHLPGLGSWRGIPIEPPAGFIAALDPS